MSRKIRNQIRIRKCGRKVRRVIEREKPNIIDDMLVDTKRMVDDYVQSVSITFMRRERQLSPDDAYDIVARQLGLPTKTDENGWKEYTPDGVYYAAYVPQDQRRKRSEP